MIKVSDQDPFTTRSHKVVIILSYLLIFVVALRRTNDLLSPFTREFSLILIALFLILFMSESFFSKRLHRYSRIYILIQFLVIQLLALFREYQDTWSLLFIVLGFQTALRFPRKEAFFWFSIFILSIFGTLIFEFGFISGFGRAMAWIVIGVFLISYDIQYSQHEVALEESRVLLDELREANTRLEDYAEKSIKLAASEERNRLTQNFYDTVGQKIFAIQLAAETSRALIDADPQRLITEINQLQSLTQSALTDMRQLISNWRLE